MPRFKPVDKRRLFPELAAILGAKLQPPFGVVLGSPGEVSELVGALPSSDVTCFQMDLFQADRLRVELKESGNFADVKTAPDLWDLPAPLQTIIYPVPLGGEPWPQARYDRAKLSCLETRRHFRRLVSL